jgi:two-component system sensor histidine kinase ChvG
MALPSDLFRRFLSPGRSIAASVLILLFACSAVPLILYVQFRKADDDKKAIVLRAAQQQAALIMNGLRPLIDQFNPQSVALVADAVRAMANDGLTIRLLLHTDEPEGEGVFLVAAAPGETQAQFEPVRQRLSELGLLARAPRTCMGSAPIEARIGNDSGINELLFAIASARTAAGCWSVLTSWTAAAYLETSIGRPYWQSGEMRLAALVYGGLTALVMGLFLSVWLHLRRFQRLAHDLRAGRSAESFETLNRMPELSGVAREFDRLIGGLRSSAELIRHVAEENIHALKTPVATIGQLVVPLRQAVPAADSRSREALDGINRSLDKIDRIISTSRRMDWMIADLLDPTRQRINVSDIINDVVVDFEDELELGGIGLERDIAPGVHVRGAERLFEAIMGNLIENAVGFSPRGGKIRIVVRRDGANAEVVIEDTGPGVAEEDLDRIFEQNFSRRPEPRPEGANNPSARPMHHFGMGLWFVRRNTEAMGGTVRAVNAAGAGLRVIVRLPFDR